MNNINKKMWSKPELLGLTANNTKGGSKNGFEGNFGTTIVRGHSHNGYTSSLPTSHGTLVSEYS